jgi:hypothetical protein
VSTHGAQSHAWHRDFPTLPETYEQRRIISLALNLMRVDIIQNMGSFKISSLIQWIDARDWKYELFLSREIWS